MSWTSERERTREAGLLQLRLRGESFDAAARALGEADILRLRLDGRLHETVAIRPRLIDLFAGAGGMTAGFAEFDLKSGGTRLERHVFRPVWANDFNRDAAETYRLNFGHMTFGSIVDIVEDERATGIPEADVVIGGPPCRASPCSTKSVTAILAVTCGCRFSTSSASRTLASG